MNAGSTAAHRPLPCTARGSAEISGMLYAKPSKVGIWSMGDWYLDGGSAALKLSVVLDPSLGTARAIADQWPCNEETDS